jgi:alkanesulfonate monooxygenase SsuD/methylene tetrahydromethanopterin reductase-like flavin-dependent oxidoreductase (luciferase family)
MGGNYNQDFREMVDNVAAAGTPQAVADKLTAFVEAGARHFVFMPSPGPGGDSDAIIRRLLDDVMPHVRERAVELMTSSD